MAEPVRVALVGCGGVGLRHLAAYEALARNGVETVELVGICDSNPERAAGALAGYRERTGNDLQLFSTFDQITAADAVDLAIPTWLHCPLT